MVQEELLWLRDLEGRKNYYGGERKNYYG